MSEIDFYFKVPSSKKCIEIEEKITHLRNNYGFGGKGSLEVITNDHGTVFIRPTKNSKLELIDELNSEARLVSCFLSKDPHIKLNLKNVLYIIYFNPTD